MVAWITTIYQLISFRGIDLWQEAQNGEEQGSEH